jgi:hypothetical protein
MEPLSVKSRVVPYVVFLSTLFVILAGLNVAKWLMRKPRAIVLNECSGTITADHITFQPSWSPSNGTWVSIEELRGAGGQAYRERYRIDEFLHAAESQLHHDATLCGISALEYGSPLRMTYFRGAVALNGFYAPCGDTLERTARVSEESVLCNGTAATLRYTRIHAAYFNLNAGVHVIEELADAEAFCFQHHIDLQNGGRAPCEHNSGNNQTASSPNVWYMRCATAETLAFGRAMRAGDASLMFYVPKVEL